MKNMASWLKDDTHLPAMRVVYQIALLTALCILTAGVLNGRRTQEFMAFSFFGLLALHYLAIHLIYLVRKNKVIPITVIDFSDLVHVNQTLLGRARVPAALAVFSVPVAFWLTRLTPMNNPWFFLVPASVAVLAAAGFMLSGNMKSPHLVLYRVVFFMLATLLVSAMLIKGQQANMRFHELLQLLFVQFLLLHPLSVAVVMSARIDGKTLPPVRDMHGELGKVFLGVSTEMLGATKIPALLAWLAVIAVFFYTKQFVW